MSAQSTEAKTHLSDWPVRTLRWLVDEKIVELGRGKVISKKTMAATPGSYPVYSSAKENEGKFGEYGLYMFDEELITWSVDGGGRLFHRKPHRFSVTNVGGTMRILDRQRLDYRFLYHAICSEHSKVPFDWVLKAHPSVLLKLYNSIPLPPLAEQKRIAEVLDEAFAAIDAATANYRQQEVEGDSLFRARLEAAMSGESVENLPLLPLSEFLSRQPRNGWSPPKAFQTGDGVPVLTLSAVTGFQFDASRVTMSSAPTKADGHYWLEEGDLLITRSNTPQLVGHVAVADCFEGSRIVPDLIMRMRTDPEVLNAQYAWFWLRTTRARDYLIENATGASSTMKKISKSVVQAIPVRAPDVEQQVSVVAMLQEAEEQSKVFGRFAQEKLTALNELRRSLLHRAFTGQLTSAGDDTP